MATGCAVRSREASAALSPTRALLSEELDRLVREGARQMLVVMLEAEVEEFLQRTRYQRGGQGRGYRNGYAPERTIGVGLGAIPIRQPRVRDVPKEVAPEGFRSQIVRRYQRLSASAQQLLTRLYLEGVSTGDFEPVFRSLLGETAPLSPSSIVRLKAEGQAEFATWQKRPFDPKRDVYCWVDGIYLRTTNPIEAIFAGVRLRTNVTKRALNRENAQYLVFKVIERLSQNWRRITGSNLCALVLSGRRFVDGKLVDREAA